MRNKLYNTVYICLIILYGCSQKPEDICNKYKNMNNKELDFFLNNISSYQLHHYIYELGECKEERSVPFLLKNLNNKQISNDIRHKGMSVRYLAVISLSKIMDKNITYKQNDSERKKITVINFWKKELNGRE